MIRHLVLYGSLRRGQANFARLKLQAGLRFVRTVRFRGLMYDLGAYPGVVEGDGEVTGELFEMRDAALLARLDAFEQYRPDQPDPYDAATGRGSLYRRTTIQAGGVTAYLYLYNGPATDLGKAVKSGDWVRRKAMSR